MKTTALLPYIAERDMREAWTTKGMLDSRERAMRRARQILSKSNPAALSPELDERLRLEFPGLVAGESVPI
jgi:trimethylamine--corrinoid protein Co-methyltransferase